MEGCEICTVPQMVTRLALWESSQPKPLQKSLPCSPASAGSFVCDMSGSKVMITMPLRQWKHTRKHSAPSAMTMGSTSCKPSQQDVSKMSHEQMQPITIHHLDPPPPPPPLRDQIRDLDLLYQQGMLPPAPWMHDHWQWLCYQGYLPANIDRRQVTLDRKREEYHNFVKQYYPTRHEDIHKGTFRQVRV